MAEKLSVLIFSRNDADDALSLINDIYKVADDIVLVDSSDRKRHKKLVASKKRLALGKLRIFYAVPLGYPDPLRMWALKKCRYGWVLLLDTDERLSKYGKDNVKELISSSHSGAFAIKRYENYTGRSLGSFFTWQLRLFRKNAVVFRGIVHEQAQVDGVVEKTSDKFYIGHFKHLRGRASFQYGKMSMFDRMSYEMAKDRLMEYLNKIVVPREGSVGGARSGKVLRGLLDAYRRLRLKRSDEELSDIDYLIFFSLVDMGYRIKEGKFGELFKIYAERKDYMKHFNENKGMPQKEAFEISKKIYEVGLIRFLELDRESTIKKLNKKYENSKGGISLTIELLRLRYEKGDKWLGRI